MKIKINENENYNIDLPQEISVFELQEILSRLNAITKLISRDVLSLNVNTTIKQTGLTTRKNYTRKNPFNKMRGGGRSWCNTKEKTIELLKLHYHGNKIDKINLAKTLNLDWFIMCKSFSGLVKRFKINSQEVGLIRFPIKSDGYGAVNTLRLPNFNFKHNPNIILKDEKKPEQENKTENISEIEQQAINDLNKLKNENDTTTRTNL